MSKRQPWKRVVKRDKVPVVATVEGENFSLSIKPAGRPFRLVDVLECGHKRVGFFGVDHAPSRSPYRTNRDGEMIRKCNKCPRVEVG